MSAKTQQRWASTKHTVLQLKCEEQNTEDDRCKSGGASTEDDIANIACRVVAVEPQLTIVTAIHHNAAMVVLLPMAYLHKCQLVQQHMMDQHLPIRSWMKRAILTDPRRGGKSCLNVVAWDEALPATLSSTFTFIYQSSSAMFRQSNQSLHIDGLASAKCSRTPKAERRHD